MTDHLNVSVLVCAKNEYLTQLKRNLFTLIQEGFVSIYEDACEQDSDNPLRQFQIFLKEIPKWNQTILDEEAKRIKIKCPYLMDLVTAIFVSHVKILASVRIGGDHKNIRIKIPTAEIFIHSIYVGCAESFYYDPHPFEDVLERTNMHKIKEIIDLSVEDTISAMIPIQDILQEYLSKTFSDHINPPPEPEILPDPPSDRILGGNDIVDEPLNFIPTPPSSPVPPSDANEEDFTKGDLFSDDEDDVVESKTVTFSDPTNISTVSIGNKTTFEDKIPLVPPIPPPPSNDLFGPDPEPQIEESVSEEISNILSEPFAPTIDLSNSGGGGDSNKEDDGKSFSFFNNNDDDSLMDKDIDLA